MCLFFSFLGAVLFILCFDFSFFLEYIHYSTVSLALCRQSLIHFTERAHTVLFCYLYYLQKKKIQQRNSLITKERKRSDKNNARRVLFCFSLSLLELLLSLCITRKCIKLKLGSIYIRTKIRNILLLLLLRCCLVSSCYIDQNKKV
jgi:hypothetical protein